MQILRPSPRSRPLFRFVNRCLENFRGKAERSQGRQKFDYFKKLSASALPATLETLGWEKGGADWVNVCLFGIALIMVWILGATAMALDQWFLGSILLLGCVLALPLLFLWKIFVAAYEMDENVRAEFEASRMPAWSFDETVAKKLRDLLDQGNELVGSRTVAEKRPPENVWVEDLVSWCTRAQDLITKNLPRSDAMGFITASVSPNVEHSPAELESILRARLDTLRRIAMRYMEFAPS